MHKPIMFTIIWYMLNLLVILGSLTDKIRFGHGLGDLAYIGIISCAICVVGFFQYRGLLRDSSLSSTGDKILFAFCVLFLIFVCLKITIWRGVEYPWNGNIFYK